jgi:hypothetical protein
MLQAVKAIDNNCKTGEVPKTMREWHFAKEELINLYSMNSSIAAVFPREGCGAGLADRIHCSATPDREL